ncbi:hypothetical protein CV944_04525 [Geobacillus sp. WSUCF-018B]|nr:hypothetical protein CV944_04525 [Geobacillus sp. WSUCF-018B]
MWCNGNSPTSLCLYLEDGDHAGTGDEDFGSDLHVPSLLYHLTSWHGDKKSEQCHVKQNCNLYRKTGE